MKISANVVADSLNEFGNRITTMEVVFPRFILAELNTHRMFSRNSASSRAIPFEKMVKMVQENPFIPIAWQKDHKGMQGTEYLNEFESHIAKEHWLKARDYAILQATLLSRYKATKQLCNRLLEPFMWHKVLITATEWENFFALRCPQYLMESYDDYDNLIPENTEVYRSKRDVVRKAGNWFIGKDENKRFGKFPRELSELEWFLLNKGQAEIHMMALAEAMWDAYNESTPKQLKAGEWHIPYGEQITEEDYEYILGDEGQSQSEITANLGYDEDEIEEIMNTGNYEWSEKYQVWLTKNMIDYTQEEFDTWRIKVATARCARVSYTTVGEEDKPANYPNDIKLHDKLLESQHMSPFEHCARAMSEEEYEGYTKTYGEIKEFIEDDISEYRPLLGFTEEKGWCRNFRGFIQYRYLIENK